MKNKASLFLKQIISLLSSEAKAKSLATKNKTSTFKARILVLSLMKSKKFLMSSIPNKIHSLLNHHSNEDSEDDDGNIQSKAIVLSNAKANNNSASSSTNLEENIDDHASRSSYCYCDEEDDDDKYPDLRHCLFGEDFDDPGGSIIDIVKNSKEDGQIDHVADLFIMRFHKQMLLQKQASFKRYREMVERSV